jgi:hypothetical protein
VEPRHRLHLLIAAAALAAPAAFPAGAAARTLLSQREALALAFPAGTTVERRTLYLSSEQLAEAGKRGRVSVGSSVWTYYVGLASGAVVGYAYFDTHVVRTMNETFMAVLEPDGRVRSVELLAFAEPDDYLPRASWLRQFDGKSDARELFVGRAIRNIGGATLTSQALADGVRRVVAVHETLRASELAARAQAASR